MFEKDMERRITRGKMFETVEVKMVNEAKAIFHYTEICTRGGDPSNLNYKNSTGSGSRMIGGGCDRRLGGKKLHSSKQHPEKNKTSKTTLNMLIQTEP